MSFAVVNILLKLYTSRFLIFKSVKIACHLKYFYYYSSSIPEIQIQYILVAILAQHLPV